jgi:MerR family transcriptional regulator, thiopeptide resistance regulator
VSTELGQYAAEAEQRWGDTDAYAESRRRTATYDKTDWQQMEAEQAAVEANFVAALSSGVAAGSPAAMDLAEAHRQVITKWFYDCSYDLHRGLAQLYLDDPRFAAHYDDQAAGLAQYVHDAITANADRSSG